MGKGLVRGSSAPVVYYVPQGTGQDLMPLTPAEVAARRRTDQVLYARWVERQAEFAERDRRVRRFMLGFGAVLALVLVAGVAVLGWLAYRAGGGMWLVLLVPLVVLALAGMGAGGRRCVTIVQHWH